MLPLRDDVLVTFPLPLATNALYCTVVKAVGAGEGVLDVDGVANVVVGNGGSVMSSSTEYLRYRQNNKQTNEK